ncbi:MAG: ATP synthase F1 subunit delta [Candidatus Omnitrophica bacterium CG07_land_8_20_14_0_80_42_15]|uniref:ATP synthase subunit delta n=1 Tax=Candidatus Aquitaenariimonas noxiae TaxID=1974741 RepID=A0A2J0KQV4_9BACT|nr:MAG: ATP synthase F1 subunit delta [Candidatus Omnitrophica bacterium CG07_land_8_20_14_0_80_42_15]
MKNKIITKRYSVAFVSYAKDTMGIRKAVDEMKGLKIILSQNPELKSFLENLEITYSEKCEIIDSVLKDFSEETRQLLKVLLEKGRIKNIVEIADYVRINYGHGEAVNALLKTAYIMELENLQEIKVRIEKNLKKKLNLFLELDPNLLGGIQVIVGNTVIDGSIRRRLDDLNEKLMTVKVS